MNILHITSGDLWAGVEAQVCYTIKALNKYSSHNVSAILFNKGELYNRLTQAEIKTYITDEQTYNGLQICKQLKKLFIKLLPDIIHVHEYKSHILSCIANDLTNNKAKIIRTLHGITEALSPIRNCKSYFILQSEKLFLKYKCSCIISVSKDIESIYRNKYPNTLVHHINNSVEYPPSISKSSKDMRKAFNIGTDTFWIGTTARLVPVKNIAALIEVAKLLNDSQEKIDFKVSIFGDGILKEKLNENIRQFGLERVVTLHGHSQDILPLLNAFDIFVLTSKHEGLPISLLEAMSLGTVPVCTRVGGIREVIDDKKNGFLVDCGDLRGFADIIHDLYHNKCLRDTIANNAIQRIKEHFSIDKSVLALQALYNTLMNDCSL